jgi:hypothetical protein
MFDIGQRVVCVNAQFPRAVLNYLRNLPQPGGIYTVRDLIPAQAWDGSGTCAVLLSEVRNPPAPHRKQWGECGFDPGRFRELTPEEVEAMEWASNQGIL